MHKFRVKTMLIQHGTITEEPFYGPTKADKWCVFGEKFKENLVSNGVKPSKIVVTGMPRFDDIINRNYEDIDIYSMLSIEKGKDIVMFATQPCMDEGLKRRSLELVFKEMKKFKNLQLVLKLHPGEDGLLHEKIKKESRSDVIISKEIDTYELMHACKIFITFWSTTGLEAMMMDKDVIMLNLSGEPDKIDYASSGAAIGVYKDSDFSAAIKNLLEGKVRLKRKNYVEKYAYKLDGKASQRVKKVVDSLCKR